VGPKLVYDTITELMASQNKHGIGNARLQYQLLWRKFFTKFAQKWNIMTRSARNVINQWRQKCGSFTNQRFSCSAKSLWAPPFVERERERVIRLRGRPLGREIEEERDHSWEGSIESKEVTTSGGGRRCPAMTPLEEKEDPSEASPWSMAPCLAPWWGKLLICPWGCVDGWNMCQVSIRKRTYHL
jgi:hypothetical protein